MIRIVILGTGNVAKHLFDAFIAQNTIEIVQVYGRNRRALDKFKARIDVTSDFSKIKEADVYIMAISDDAIVDVSKKLPLQKGLVVHTSGSIPMTSLSNNTRRGAFYPLQTFSANRKVVFKEVPMCIEAENRVDYDLLHELASNISNAVIQIDSDQRKSLHLAAVFANNFSNHMYLKAQEVCEQNSIPFDILRPLIKETAAKIQDLPPLDAQTGPAKRNNLGTIEKHLAQLENENQKKIYSLLSKSIQNTYGKKL